MPYVFADIEQGDELGGVEPVGAVPVGLERGVQGVRVRLLDGRGDLPGELAQGVVPSAEQLEVALCARRGHKQEPRGVVAVLFVPDEEVGGV